MADRASYDAGGITFKVSNKDATGITEFELLDGVRILGEKENLPPGFAGSFSLSLNPGRYEMYCPGAATPRAPFTVTGTASSAAATDTKALLNQGTKNYGTYVEAQIGFLLTNVQPLVAGDQERGSGGSQGRLRQGAPVLRADRTGRRVVQGSRPRDRCPRADDGLAPTKLTGFHRIEYGRWSVGSVAGLAPVADKLAADVGKLQKLATGLHYQPAELANGAVGLLDEVSKSKVTGEEERYSHIDLLDFQANVEGSEQAFANLQPGLAKIDSTLTGTISARFAALNSLLDKYRDKNQPSGFVLYTSLTRADVTTLAQSVQAVAEPVSRVASKVVNV